MIRGSYWLKTIRSTNHQRCAPTAAPAPTAAAAVVAVVAVAVPTAPAPTAAVAAVAHQSNVLSLVQHWSQCTSLVPKENPYKLLSIGVWCLFTISIQHELLHHILHQK